MITVSPGATFEAWAQGFATGLTGTLGVRIRDGAGADFLARTTSGIAEDIASSGIYRKANFTAPTTGGQYQLVWDNGSGEYATEELLVTYTATAVAAAANEYVTVSELTATLSLTGETFAEADITIAVYAASRAIDGICGRRFYADSDALQVRYYSPWDRELLVIDDLTTLGSVKTDPGGDGTFEETWTENTDFLLEPLNPELIDGTNRKPWTLITRHPSGSYYFPTVYPRSVKVTGKFGWAVVPKPVSAIATVLASRIVRRMREAPFGVVGLGFDGGAVRIPKVDPDLALLLTPYTRGLGIG